MSYRTEISKILKEDFRIRKKKAFIKQRHNYNWQNCGMFQKTLQITSCVESQQSLEKN